MFVQTIIFSVLWKISLSARILAVFHLSSYSQQSISLPITKELSLRGHEVVVFTSHPLKDRSLVNLTEIDLSYLRKYYSGKDGLQKQLTTDQSFENYVRNFYNFDKFLSESVLNNADFQKMYRDPNEKFDLIFIHGLSPTFHILGKRFKAPVIGITSLPATISNHESVGNVVSQLIYSNMIDWHFEKTELIKKVLNLFHFIWYKYYYNWHIIPTYDAMVRKALDDDMPSLSILEKNVSFMYINDHPILHKVRPSVPTTLYLNQIHIKPVKPLPEDLRQIIDNAKNGVVYFSLGSNVQCINIKKDILNVIIETCNELPFTVLFKWEYDDFPGKSKNIVNRKWFPQQDLLAHENVKVFITQGGLQSIEEAVVHVKPMVGIPFASDQYYNVKTLEKHGAAISIDINTVTKEELKNAIIQVARNKSYKETMRKLKTLHVDVPMSGLEKAVWWAEYVIRHRALNIVGAIQINYVKVPSAVRNNSNKPVILDCHYSVRPDDSDLVVKWFLNNDIVYQWIPPQKPQSLGRLKNRVDLEYKASDDPKSIYRALKILNPTNDIAGEYKCFVSTFADEDFSMKNMIVFEPERYLVVTQSTFDTTNMNFTCYASEVFPTPKLALYKDNKDGAYIKTRLPTIQWDVSKHSTGRFSVFIVASVVKESLTPGTLIHCELRIPGTGYVKVKSLLYYPEDLEKNATELSTINIVLLKMVLLINFLRYF